MPLLSDSPSARATIRRRPWSPLTRAVLAAVIRFEEVGGVGGHTARRQIDRALREALEDHLERLGESGPTDAVPAVRVACAHLAAGDLEDAYLALLTARDLLR